MLFNSSLATTIALLASAGIAAAAAAAAADAPNDQRLRRLGRVAPRQNDCASDADCSGGVCCSGIAFGPGEGAGLSVCVFTGCDSGTCDSGIDGAQGFCSAT
ncbi:hypothetical protein GGX14DRAFT_405814 [Mycena pura]|uniref:Uncharacterized protein n=1 Tax=Mycena pura TaxID=153505 RepID=A0AAD6UUP8_9AGAR|nr:hypothetical protein GGX14DRAFT_405814 [Mycena pura]